MKTLNNILSFFLLVILLAGCNDNFLDREPYGSLTESTFFQTEEHAVYATNACYSPLKSLNGFWATGTLLFGNLCSDDCLQNDAVNSSYVRGDYNPGDNYLVNGCYKNAYSGIARCNSNIKKVDQMPDGIIDADMKNRLIAEMRFIRAFWYFRLVRLYGDVPMITEPVKLTDEAALYPSRTNLATIYSDVIIPDFEFAAGHLPEKYTSSDDASRVTKGAAHAFLSLVYLNTEDWNKAIAEGEKVVKIADKGIYQLLENPNDVLTEFNEFNNEIIFEIAFSKDQQNWKTKYYGPQNGSICRGGVYNIHFHPNPDLVNAFSLIDGSTPDEDPNALYDTDKFWLNRDPRFDIAFYTGLDEFETIAGNQVTFDMSLTHNKSGKVDFQKNTVYYGPNNSSIGLDNVIMRYAEVLLNLAEAYIMSDSPDYTKAASNINAVRSRARTFALNYPEKYNPNNIPVDKVLPNITVTGKDDGIAKLRYERRVEFAGEDIRGYDIRRWGIEADTWAKAVGFKWEERISLLPIPQSEINVNNNLLPNNKGY